MAPLFTKSVVAADIAEKSREALTSQRESLGSIIEKGFDIFEINTKRAAREH